MKYEPNNQEIKGDAARAVLAQIRERREIAARNVRSHNCVPGGAHYYWRGEQEAWALAEAAVAAAFERQEPRRWKPPFPPFGKGGN